MIDDVLGDVNIHTYRTHIGNHDYRFGRYASAPYRSIKRHITRFLSYNVQEILTKLLKIKISK